MADSPAATARTPLDLGGAPHLGVTADAVEAVAHYGDPEAEQRALAEGCGLVDRLWVDHLELRGEDRQRFLNGLVTCEVKSLAPGSGVFGYLTSAQGRVLAEARIEAHGDRLTVELPAGLAGPIGEHLGRYVVADRVEIAPAGELRALALVGPEAPELAARLLGWLAASPPISPPVSPDRTASSPAPLWSVVSGEWRGAAVSLLSEGRLGAPAICVRLPAAAAGELARALIAAGARPAGLLAAECLRVEAGLARYGADFDSERFPQEVDGGAGLDFEKGCYLGQEVIARIHYRGKVNHRLAGLVVEGGPPAPGSAVSLEGAEVGKLGHRGALSRHAATLALAVLHRRAETGARVEVDGTPAQIVALPFAHG